MENRWVIREKADADLVRALSRSLNINESLASILLLRGVSSFDNARDFFRPSLDHLHDPFLMKDMDKAVNRLSEAISNEEKILIYGDYDVDGTTSVALVFGFLQTFTQQLEYYIPDRYTEGYGISEQGILYASEHDFTLIISLDCGIRAVDRAAQARSLGIDLIICDHHLPGPELPEALAILDAKQPDDAYPYKELSGCGVGFKLLQGFCLQNSISTDLLFQHVDLVAVSIASDIVPITGENRVLAYYGLKKINHSPAAGLKALMDISGLRSEIDITSVVFYIGPRINATGRLGHAHDSVKLLLAKDPSETEEYAHLLHAQNDQRKNFDKSITEEALTMLEYEYPADVKSTVLYKDNWHKGIVGIVASRCVEKYYRPTIILTSSDSKATGSARSVNGFDIHEAISACSDLLEKFGGHAHAAGLTLAVENVDLFREKFEQVVSDTIDPELLQPMLEIDLEVTLDFVNHKNYSIIKQMEPFGPLNSKPLFVSHHLKPKYPPKVIKEDHLKLSVYQEGNDFVYDAIGFGLASKLDLINNSPDFSLVYQIEENQYRGQKSLQLNIKDIKN